MLQSQVRIAILDVLDKNIEGLTATQIQKELSKRGIKGTLPGISKHLRKLQKHGMLLSYNVGLPPHPVYRIEIMRAKIIIPLLNQICLHLETAVALGHIRESYDRLIDLKRELSRIYDSAQLKKIRQKFENFKKDLKKSVENCLVSRGHLLKDEEKARLRFLLEEL